MVAYLEFHMAPVGLLLDMGTLPKHSVRPRGGAGLLAAVPVVRAGVKLVRGDEGDVALGVTIKNSALETLLFELVGIKKSL